MNIYNSHLGIYDNIKIKNKLNVFYKYKNLFEKSDQMICL